jgi:hypothetical protein
MLISTDMDLRQLAERMGSEATEAEADAMRKTLVEWRDGEDTADIDCDTWGFYLNAAVRDA